MKYKENDEILSNEMELIIYIVKEIIRNDNFILDKYVVQNVDLDKLLETAFEQNIFPIIYKYIKNHIELSKKTLYRHNYLVSKFNKNSIVDHYEKIYKNCRELQIKPVFYKGAVLSSILYNDLYLRQYSDIDILLKSEDMSVMDMILKKEGFYTDKEEFYKSEQHKSFRYCSYTKKFDGGVINVDISNCIHGISIEKLREAILYETDEISFNGNVINTFNITFTLITLFANLYFKIKNVGSKGCLREYMDLCILTMNYRQTINWNYTKNLFKVYGIVDQINFIFENMKIIFNDSIPDEIIDLF